MAGKLLKRFRTAAPIANRADGSATKDFLQWLDRVVHVSNVACVPEKGILWASIDATDIATYFDETGLGLLDRPYAGFAICNGSNGTPDLDGSLIRGDVSGGGAAGSYDFQAGATSAAYQDLVPLMRLEVSA